jgi:hypothetical protein
VRDVVKDLVAKPLPDDFRRYLARTKSRDPRGLAVVTRDLLDLGIHHGAGDFDDEVLARV